MRNEIILASGSEARRVMLDQAGVVFRMAAPKIDEDSVKASLINQGAGPRDIADALAELKAARISGQNPDAWVIGSDQVLELDGKLYSKPKDMTEARAQLSALSGKRHKLISAAVILHNGVPEWRHIGEVRLTMRPVSAAYIDDYLSRMGTGILATVGCYKLESEGVRLFSRIEGDYFSVLGMPLVEVLAYLTSRGAIAG